MVNVGKYTFRPMDPMGYATFTTLQHIWPTKPGMRAMPMLCQRPEGVSEILGEVGETDSGATWHMENSPPGGSKNISTRQTPQVGVEI